MLRTFKLTLAVLIGLTILIAIMFARSSLIPGTGENKGTDIALQMPRESKLPGEPEVRASERLQPVASGILIDNDARIVGGGLIAAPVVIEGPLERIEALPQPVPPAPPEPAKQNTILRWRLIYNSVISAAGVFDLNGTALVLPGIDIVPANEACTAPNGTTWHCGMVARTAFRNYVKGRAITCRVPDAPSQQSLAVECLLAGQDMAAWLVDQGWARAKPATIYADLETAAKGDQRGIHGNPPRGVEAVSKTGDAPVLPREPATNP